MASSIFLLNLTFFTVANKYQTVIVITSLCITIELHPSLKFFCINCYIKKEEENDIYLFFFKIQ